jgi:hypothetical protein
MWVLRRDEQLLDIPTKYACIVRVHNGAEEMFGSTDIE